MALKECRECNETVSTQAKRCPHCGAKKPTASRPGPAAIGCLILLIAVFLLSIIGSTGTGGSGARVVPVQRTGPPLEDRSSTQEIRGQRHSVVGTSEVEETSSEQWSWGYKCAVIDRGFVDRDATVVNRYEYLISAIAGKCKTTEQDVSDAAVTARNRLVEHYGIDVSVLAVLEAAHSVPDNFPMLQPTDRTASLFVLVIQAYKGDLDAEMLRNIGLVEVVRTQDEAMRRADEEKRKDAAGAQAATEQRVARETQKAEALIESGFVKSVDVEKGSAVVDADMWLGKTEEERKDIAMTLGWYRHGESGKSCRMVVRDTNGAFVALLGDDGKKVLLHNPKKNADLGEHVPAGQ